jgi:hypothetical protein
LRQRWFGTTRQRVPAIVVEGETDFPTEPLVLDDVSDTEQLRAAFDGGTPVAVRAASAEAVLAALSRPEVSCVIVPAANRDLVELDLVELTYGP